MMPKNRGVNLTSIVPSITREVVIFTYYPGGSSTMEGCGSYSPFRISSEDDVNFLIALIRQIRDRIMIRLNDPCERIVSDINSRTLKQCNVNVDIAPSLGQLTLLDIQISTFCCVLWVYVKILESKVVYRLEALDCIIHPTRVLEKELQQAIAKIDILTNKVNLLSRVKEQDNKAKSSKRANDSGSEKYNL